MDINQTNYEEYVLDYLEGTLSSSEQVKMDEFLTKHPDIKESISDLLAYKLPKEELNYPLKRQLTNNPAPTISWIRMSIAAASVLLLATFSLLVIQNKNQQPTADNQEIQTPVNQNDDNHELQLEVAEQNQTSEESNEPRQVEEINPKHNEPKIQEEQLAAYELEPVISPKEPDSNKHPVKVEDNKVTPNELKLAIHNQSQNPAYSVTKEDTANSISKPKSTEGNIAKQDKLEKKQEESASKNQIIIDNIVTEEINQAKQQEQDSEDDGGFSVEKHPEEEDLYVEDQKTKSKKDKKNTLLTILGDDSDEIKKAVLPRSFGFSERNEEKIKTIEQEKPKQ